MSFQQVNRSYIFETINPDQLPRLIVISAPAGCGKTVLAQQLVQSINYPAVWHQVDMWQRDPTRLYQKSRTAWLHHDSTMNIPENTSSSSTSARAIAEAIETQLSKPIYYILDDIHHLKHSKDAERWLQTLLNACPSNVHFIFVGRELPILDWYQEIGRGHVFSINKSHLQMRANDIMGMADISLTEAETLAENYNGWAAAIRLALDPVLKEAASQTLSTDAPEQTLFQQLATMYYRQLPVEHQHVLLVASTTEEISLRLYQDVFSLPTLRAQLEQLHLEHLLISKTREGYRFHGLFRDFLQEQLKASQPDYYEHLHLQVGQWYESQDRLEEAVTHYLEANSIEQAIQLAEATAGELLTRGLRQTLLQINELLADVDAPRVRLISSIILTDNNRIQESNDNLAIAEQGFRQRKDKQRLACVQLQRAHNQQLNGEYARAIETIHTQTSTSLPWVMQAWAKRTLGYAYLGLGQFSDAIIEIEMASRMLAQDGSGYEQAQTLQTLSEAYMRSGQFSESIATLQEVIALFRKGDNETALASALNNLACAFHLTSQYESTLLTLEEAKTLLPDVYSREAAYVYHSLGDVQRDLGNFTAADHAYSIAYQVGRHEDKTLLHHIIVSRCRLAIWMGNPYAALQWISRVDIPPVKQNLGDRILYLWQILLSIWQDSEEYSVETVSHHVQYLIEAQATKALGKIVGILGYLGLNHLSLQKLFRTISGQIPAEFLQPLVADAYHLPQLGQMIQKDSNLWQGIRTHYQYLSEAIQARSIVTQIQSRQIELRMLGQDTIIIGETPLPNGAWASPQTRAFLYCLILYGKQNKVQLSKHLWPEHTQEQARNALRQARQGLKSVLADLVLYDGTVYHLNPDYQINTDIRLFEDSVHRARQLPSRDARTETLFLRALALYEAEGSEGLLPYLYMDWLTSLRHQYEMMYLEALQGAAVCAGVREDFSYALRLYEKYVSISPYDEAIYQAMMRCYANKQQLPQVQLVYNRLNRLLDEDLDVAPHPETTALLNRLLI